MKREYFIINLPYQDPQIVEVRLWGGGFSRLRLLDRYSRPVWLQGESVGFNVQVYRQMVGSPPKVKLVIFGNYEKALYTNWDQSVTEVKIEPYHTKDQTEN